MQGEEEVSCGCRSGAEPSTGGVNCAFCGAEHVSQVTRVSAVGRARTTQFVRATNPGFAESNRTTLLLSAAIGALIGGILLHFVIFPSKNVLVDQ